MLKRFSVCWEDEMEADHLVCHPELIPRHPKNWKSFLVKRQILMFSLRGQNHQNKSREKQCMFVWYHTTAIRLLPGSNDGPGIIFSPPFPLWVQYIPVMLHFTLLVCAVTAAHHYGTAWANFNGCHRQQEQMQACQRKHRTEAKKDGLLCRG